MTYITTKDNFDINYNYTKKEKETLVFIHGWNLNQTIWKEETKNLNDFGYSTLTYDIRGHGKSNDKMPNNEHQLAHYAADLKLLLDELKIEKPILVGHSFGGMIIQKAINIYPNLAKKIVLVDTTYRNPLKDIKVLKSFNLTPYAAKLLKYIQEQKNIKRRFFHNVDFSKFKNKSDFYNWIRGTANTEPNILLSCINEMLKFDAEKNLEDIKIPTLLIVGENDKDTPVEVSKHMNEKIKNSRLVIIKDANHDTPITHPEIISKEIIEFIL